MAFSDLVKFTYVMKDGYLCREEDEYNNPEKALTIMLDQLYVTPPSTKDETTSTPTIIEKRKYCRCAMSEKYV